MQCFIGVDGGATKTRVVIGDAGGCRLGEGVAGPSNHQVVGVAHAAANLAVALDIALVSAGHSSQCPAQMIGGMAGLDSAEDVPMIHSLVTEALHTCNLQAVWRMVNDTVVAWAGALRGQPGAIVISGSGAAALAVNGQGATFRCDGLGHWLGDEGSGFEIGRNGLRAALHALDGRGPDTALVEPMQRMSGGDTYGWAAHLAEDSTLAHETMARFAPNVAAAALDGDTVALTILTDAGRALARTGASVLRRAGLLDSPLVATVGSLFAHAGPLREAFCQEMAVLLPGCQVIWPRQQPAEGALLLARQPELLPKSVLRVRKRGP